MSDTTRQTARDQRAADQANTTANEVAAGGDTSTTAQAPADPSAKAQAEADRVNRNTKGSDDNTPVDPVLDEERARLRDEADAADKAEATKAKAAKDGTTGDPSGNPAGVAFSQRIADAKFTLRNQGHTEIEALLDDMHAGLQRVEAKFTT